MPSLLPRLVRAVKSRLGYPLPLVSEELLGKAFQVRERTIRGNTDYDEAWMLALDYRSVHVVDIGANIGQAFLLMLRAASIEQLIPVEPNPNAMAIAALKVAA